MSSQFGSTQYYSLHEHIQHTAGTPRADIDYALKVI